MNENDKGEGKRFKIEVKCDPELATGQYVNMARILHTQAEFMVDALMLPIQSREARVMARLILSPAHAKSLHAALGQNLQMYEKKFGTITIKPPGGGDPGPIIH